MFTLLPLLVSFSGAVNYLLLVDWNGDGDFGDSYENVTADVLIEPGITCRRGRDSGTQLTARSTAGTLACTLLNTSGRYSPDNAASPLFGLLKPGRLVQLRATYPVAATLWTGYLDEAPRPKASRDGVPVAELRASGPLVKLADQAATVSPAASSGALTGALVGTVLDAAGWPAALRAIDAGKTLTGRWFVQDVTALAALRELEDSELGFIVEGADGAIVFEDRHHRLSGAHRTSQATYSDSGAGGTFGYSAIESARELSGIANEVVIDVQPLSVGSIAVLWTLSEQAVIAAGASQTFIALYTGSGGYVETWTTPNFGAGDIVQSGVLDAEITVSVVKAARQMAITLTNTNVARPAVITLLRARGTPVTPASAVQVSRSDAGSQSDYGKRRYAFPGRWLPTVNVAQDYADAVLARWKDPVPLPTISIPASKDSAHLTEALSRQISDRVTVVATGSRTQLGLSADYFIEAIEHRIGAGQETRFALSPAAGEAYWILDTSTLGTATRLGF